MKTGIYKPKIDWMLLVVVAFVTMVPIHAQPDDKLQVYVWDFSVEHDSLNTVGISFTNDFESQLINSEKYEVLERRRYDRIMAHQDMENQISDIRDMSSSSKDSLKANKADAVFFGALIFDQGSGEYELTVTFQDLDGINLKKKNILLKKGLIRNNESRKVTIEQLMNKLYAKETLSAKKQQFELVDNKLNKYRARVDEITTVYNKVIKALLVDSDPVEHIEEITNKIRAYNKIWSDLNDNKGKYLQDFGSHWGKEHLREFSEIYFSIMNDFHERFIRDLDEVEADINKFRTDRTSSKSEKKNMQNAIERKTINKTKAIRIELDNKIKPKINRFLEKLREELITE